MSTGPQILTRVALANPSSNRLLARLAPEDLALLASGMKDVRLDAGMVLYEGDDPIQHVYFPHAGMISLTAVMQSGEAVETATIGREGATGVLAALGLRRAQERAIVQIPGAASRIAASHVCAAAQHSSAIRELIVDYAGVLMACFEQAIACNALHDLESRLCRLLLQVHDRADGNQLVLTQEFLAQMLGVRRTSVTMIARVLQTAGMINYRRGVIEIADRHALEQASCECYGVLRRKLNGALGTQALT